MTSIDFEEYRQPWETGPHWELKREFLETYKNDYPVDRLLCLAQAYSNIELLHCSYPEPVMREIEQCSYNLKGKKKFRQMEEDLEKKRKEKPELQARTGKRNLSDESLRKPFKFIKFCSSAVSKSSEESVNINDCPKASDMSVSCEADLSANDTVVSNCKNQLTAKNTVICIDVEKKHVSSENSTNNKCVIHSLRQFKNVNLLREIAKVIPKRHSFSDLKSLMELPDFKNVAKFCFVPESASVFCCHFYIGDILVSTGRGSNEKLAKYQALGYGLEILKNLSNLPDRTLSDIKYEWLEWKKIANYKEPLFSDGKLKPDALGSVLSEMKTNPFFADLYTILTAIEYLQTPWKKGILAMDRIIHAVSKSENSTDVFYFNFCEEPNTPLHQRLFHCDLVIGNVLICQGKSSSKKNSKTEAAEQGIISLNSFFDINEEINHGTENYVRVHSSTNINICTSPIKNINKSSFPELCSSYVAPSKKQKSNFPSHEESDSVCSSKVTNSLIKAQEYTLPQPIPTQNDIQRCNEYQEKTKFKINKRLLRNSLEQNFALFDFSGGDRGFPEVPSTILHHSMNRSSKAVTYDISQESEDSDYRCTVFANQEAIGDGIGSTQKDAKLNAAQNAIEFLQNSFYTIKEKNQAKNGFLITREQVLNVMGPKSIISENNIGHKMLKMMGWTGGTIGKTGGINEPIVPKGQISHQGLGFSSKKDVSFKQSVDQLLQDYSKTKTTNDLIFSTDFTKKERKDMHQWALKYNLQSVSYGSGTNRKLHVRHKWRVTDLLNLLVEAGGSSDRYELVDKSSCQTSQY